MNIQKYVAFLYINNEISQMESKKQSLLKSQKKIPSNKPNQRGEKFTC